MRRALFIAVVGVVVFVITILAHTAPVLAAVYALGAVFILLPRG